MLWNGVALLHIEHGVQDGDFKPMNQAAW